MQYSYDRHEDKSKIQKLAKFLAEVDEDRAKIWRSNARSMVNAFQMATEPGLSHPVTFFDCGTGTGSHSAVYIVE